MGGVCCKFSIIVPFNGEKTIHRTLESILSQSFSDFEIILIDDSADGLFEASMDRYNKFTDTSKLRVFFNGTNLGLTRSLNYGIEASVGDFIVRCDADDEMKPKRLEILDKYFTFGYDFVGNGSEFFYENGGSHQRNGDKYLSSLDIKARLKKFKPVCSHSAFAFKKSLVKKIGGYNESYVYAQDRDLLLRLLSIRASMIIVPNILTNVYMHPNAISQSKNRETQMFMGIFSQVEFELRERGLCINEKKILRCIEGSFLWKSIKKSEICKAKLRHQRLSIWAVIVNLKCYSFAIVSNLMQRILLKIVLFNLGIK